MTESVMIEKWQAQFALAGIKPASEDIEFLKAHQQELGIVVLEDYSGRETRTAILLDHRAHMDKEGYFFALQFVGAPLFDKWADGQALPAALVVGRIFGAIEHIHRTAAPQDRITALEWLQSFVGNLAERFPAMRQGLEELGAFHFVETYNAIQGEGRRADGRSR